MENHRYLPSYSIPTLIITRVLGQDLCTYLHELAFISDYFCAMDHGFGAYQMNYTCQNIISVLGADRVF